MASFSAAEVKKLRELTGAGMMDCKKALEEADGDFDKAVELLRVKGAAKAAKRGAEREAEERARQEAAEAAASFAAASAAAPKSPEKTAPAETGS